jgi:hypothetical protein
MEKDQGNTDSGIIKYNPRLWGTQPLSPWKTPCEFSEREGEVFVRNINLLYSVLSNLQKHIRGDKIQSLKNPVMQGFIARAF